MPKQPQVPRTHRSPAEETDLLDDIHRGHTILELLAGGMAQLADRLDHGTPLSRADIEEGLKLHEAFLVGILHRKEALLSEAAGKVRGNPFRADLAVCSRQHANGARAAHKMTELFGTLRPGDHASAKRLAELIRVEIQRMLDHHNQEEEGMYSKLPARVPAPAIKHVEAEFRRIRAESSAIESRITSWSSRWNPASD